MTESVDAGEVIQDSGGSNPSFGQETSVSEKLEINNQPKENVMITKKHVRFRVLLRLVLTALALLGMSGAVRLQPFAHQV
jgi:hypothetical protein